jgi:hypothetical protein
VSRMADRPISHEPIEIEISFIRLSVLSAEC